MTSTAFVSALSKLNSDFSGTAGRGMSEGNSASVVQAIPKLAFVSMRGRMWVEIVEAMCVVRVRVRESRIVWPRGAVVEDKVKGVEGWFVDSVYEGGRASFSLVDIFVVVVVKEDA
jgi:hypothetical protein